jgi:hypothetical protein
VYLYLSWNTFQRNAIHDGEWPMWDPYSFSGASFAANSQSQLYYPLTWLLWLLPLSLSIQFLTIFNIWMAGAGMYLLCRHFAVSRAGALVAGLGFAGSGMLQLATELPGVSTPYAWLPWMLIAVDNAMTRRSALWMALASLACGLQLVSGNLQWCIYSYFTLGCWIFWRFGSTLTLRRTGLKSALRTPATPLLAMAGGIALAAVHLAPLMELTGLSTRGAARVSSHSASLATLLRLLMPEYSGPLTGDGGTPLVFNDLWYVGIGVLVLALLALFLPGRPERWFWFGMALFAVAVAYGIGPFLYFRWLPGLSSLIPSRIGYLFIFSVCLLASFGLDALLKARRETAQRAAYALGLALTIVALPLLAASTIGLGSAATESLAALRRDQILRASALLGLTGGACALLIILRGHSNSGQATKGCAQRAPFLVAIVVCLVADLLIVAPTYNTYTAAEDIAPSAPSVEWLKSNASDGRAMALGVNKQPPTLVPNVQMLYAFQALSGYDSLHTARYEEYWGAVDPNVTPSQPGVPYSNVFVRPQVYTSTQAELLNTRYVAASSPISNPVGLTEVYSGEIAIYRNENALPRAFLVANAEALSRAGVLSKLIQGNFDPRKTLLLESSEAPPLQSTVSPTDDSVGSVIVSDYRRNSVTLDVDATRAGWLVLVDQNYPGWSATVDGSPQQVYTADYLLRAVPVEAGHHTVIFSFLPTNYWLTMGLSLMTLAVILVAITFSGLRAYRRRARLGILPGHSR